MAKYKAELEVVHISTVPVTVEFEAGTCDDLEALAEEALYEQYGGDFDNIEYVGVRNIKKVKKSHGKETQSTEN
jgi:hypothetical protein